MAAATIIPTRTTSYDTLIAQQQARILQLEADLARYSDKLALLRSRASPFPLPTPATPHPLPDAFAFARHAAAAAAAATSPSPAPHHPTSAIALAAAEEDDRAGKTRYWTEMEHNQFLYAVKLFGSKNYVAISQFVGTRTPKQVRTHAQKYQMKLEREARKRRTAPPVPPAGSPLAHALAAAHMPTLPTGAQTEEAAAALSAAAAHAAAAAHVAAAAQAAQAATGATESATTTLGSPMASPGSSAAGGLDVGAHGGAAAAAAAAAAASVGEVEKKDVAPVVTPSEVEQVPQAEAPAAMDFLRDSASSPVSTDDMDEMEDDPGCGEGGGVGADVVIGCGGGKPPVLPGGVGLMADVPVPAALGAGLRKNASLTNLADYDDFMRKITAAVNDRHDHASIIFDNSSVLLDVDCDDLETHVKTEQFEDSLLADM